VEYQFADNDPPIPSTPPSSHHPSRTLSSPQLINPHPSGQDGNDHTLILSQSVHNSQNLSSTSLSPSQDDIHVGFLVVGIVLIFFINGTFVSDIELTLSRNKRIQSHQEGQWGFGQVLALLLLVIPLRDFVTSIYDIRKKIREKQEHDDGKKREVQGQFENFLRTAIQAHTFDGFRALIEGGACPNTKLNGQHPYIEMKLTLTNSSQVLNLSLFFSLQHIKRIRSWWSIFLTKVQTLTSGVSVGMFHDPP